MKYYAKIDESLCGPFDAEALITLAGFTRRTLVQSQDRLDSAHPRWSESGEVPLLAVLMDMRDRGPGPAPFTLGRETYGASRRTIGHGVTIPEREVHQTTEPERASPDASAPADLERVVGRLAALEEAVRGVRTAVYLGAAVLGGVALVLAGRPWPAGRADASLPPAVAAAPAAAPVAAAPPAAPVRPAAARTRPAPGAEESNEAVELVRSFRVPASAAARCPRSVAEARVGLGAIARTPPEAVACEAMERVLFLYDTLVAEGGWSEEKAAGLLDRIIRERGGLDAVFPPSASARRLTGRKYEVALARRDLLSPALSVLLDFDVPGGYPVVLRFEADLDSGAVRRAAQ